MELEEAKEIVDKIIETGKLSKEKKEALKTIMREVNTKKIIQEEAERLFNKDELRRLEKAAKDKNKDKIIEWAIQFENSVHLKYHSLYEKEYTEILEQSINNFLIAMVYTLHFNEKCNFGNNRICDFMDDMMAAVDGFNEGGFSPEEYVKQLEDVKIYFNEINNRRNRK